MSYLEIFLLGPPKIVLDGKSLRIKRRKALALLAYLAVSGRGHSRGALTTLFWPDADMHRAHANLRHLLWILRQNGLREWLEADDESVELRQDPGLWIDVAEFRSRMAMIGSAGDRGSGVGADQIPTLAEAVDLNSGDFMAGFGVKDSVAFDEWQMHQEVMLRASLAETLDRLVRFYAARKQFRQAIVYARRWLALDPLCEPVQRRLMSLFASCGRRAQALELYETSERLLQKEYGLTPARETVDLRNRILAEEPPAEDKPVRRTRSPKITRQNLPLQPTPFMGRTRELQQIRRLLTDPEPRLITVVGPGGSGKTRLAVEAARSLSDQFRDGTFFVPLAPVSRPEFIVPAIENAFETRFSPKRPVSRGGAREGANSRRAPLLDYLHAKQVLLVLDNLEHLLGGVDLLRDVLGHAPDVRVLATSRERLHLDCEWVMDAQGLDYPTSDEEPETYQAFSAVQLFLRCGRRAKANFAPSRRDLEAIARICRLLEGNPLGIELASRWVTTISCRQIAEEIEKSFDFLTSRRRDLPKRHQSLRAVFEHSWALLCRAERTCFQRLAVFRGGFDSEAAQGVAEGSLEILSRLIDKSLLRQDDAGRYEVHEVLRQYAEEKLKANPSEHAAVCDRLSTHYLNTLTRLEGSLKGPRQHGALQALSQDGENVRMAWLGAARKGRVLPMRQAFQSLFVFYDIRSRTQEGEEIFRETIEILNQRPKSDGGRDLESSALVGLCLVARGWFLRFRSPLESVVLVEEGLEHLGPGTELAFARSLGWVVGLWRSSPEAARRNLTESVAMCEAAGDPWGAALALEILGFALIPADLSAAFCAGERSLQLRRRLGDQWGIALALYALGRIVEARGMHLVAKKRFEESLSVRRQLGEDLDGVIDCLYHLGQIARRTGDFGEARRRFEECLTIAREIGNPCRVAQSLIQLGMVAYDLGEYAQAERNLKEAGPLVETIGEDCWEDLHLSLIANVALATNGRDEARLTLEHGPACFGLDSDETSSGSRSRSYPRDPAPTSWRALGLGRLAETGGDLLGAQAYYVRALERATLDGDDPTALEVLMELALSISSGGKPEEAAGLLALVLEHPALSPPRKVRAEQALNRLAETLPPREVERSMSRAKVTKLTDIVDRILRGRPLGFPESTADHA